MQGPTQDTDVRVARAAAAVVAIVAVLISQAAAALDATAPIGSAPYINAGNPPAWRALTPAEQRLFDLGDAVFNTPFVPAGAPGAGRRSGLGPLFNAAACDQCHNEGAHGRGPLGDGPAPAAVVIELQTMVGAERSEAGDPSYGHVLNTQAVAGVASEAEVLIHYDSREGHYADGTRWNLRVPRYELSGLHYGPLEPTTVLEPRIAPPLFGLGLLEAVSGPDMHSPPGTAEAGHFNWQGTAHSILEQTTRAFSREMGLTTSVLPRDDCTLAQVACGQLSAAASVPEVQEELLQALLAFEHWVAVPTPLPTGAVVPPPGSAELFAVLGCPACHQSQLQVTLETPLEGRREQVIAPYTDLRLHDLGRALDDRTVAGRPVLSRWRTTPLWGLGYRLRHPIALTFLHDGRARSVDEAILWHEGEALRAREAYIKLNAVEREKLLQFLSSL
ncbi:MAG: di-heme oxidoredictase family protein [Steroidobacteraceae bacterium]|jgi:CxxC motif-containing protein (DUF1111 family)